MYLKPYTSLTKSVMHFPRESVQIRFHMVVMVPQNSSWVIRASILFASDPLSEKDLFFLGYPGSWHNDQLVMVGAKDRICCLYPQTVPSHVPSLCPPSLQSSCFLIQLILSLRLTVSPSPPLTTKETNTDSAFLSFHVAQCLLQGKFSVKACWIVTILKFKSWVIWGFNLQD